MNVFKILIYIIIGMFAISSVCAATIYGAVYDLSLKKVNNARVEIDTLPRQFFIAQNGSYSFSVPFGAYTIKAQSMQKNTVLASVEENITVKQDGDYVLDLILFPDVEEGIENVDIDVNSNIPDSKNSKNYALLGFGILLLIIVLIVAYYFYFIKYKKSKRQKIQGVIPEKTETIETGQDDELKKLINIIKKEGNRITQKDIRKQIPLSEAKISLMIAELEHKGIIEKIKKGRGNIIILKSFRNDVSGELKNSKFLSKK